MARCAESVEAAAEFVRLRGDLCFESAIASHLMPDQASQARRALVLERIEQMSSPAQDAAHKEVPIGRHGGTNGFPKP